MTWINGRWRFVRALLAAAPTGGPLATADVTATSQVPLPEADASPTEKPGFATPADGDADPPGDLDAYVQRLAQRRRSCVHPRALRSRPAPRCSPAALATGCARREAQLSAGRQRFVGRMQTLLEMQPAASDGADGGAHE